MEPEEGGRRGRGGGGGRERGKGRGRGEREGEGELVNVKLEDLLRIYHVHHWHRD